MKNFTLLLLLLSGNMILQAQVQPNSIRTGVTFQWQGTQPNGNAPANLQSITIGSKVHDQFIMPTGYQMDQVGPDGHTFNNIRQNNNFLANGSNTVDFNTKALDAFKSRNLNHIFQCDNNGRDICSNFSAALTTDAQKQSLLYASRIKVLDGTIIAVTERNGNNCFYVNVYGSSTVNGAETLLNKFFVQSSLAHSLWGFDYNPPLTGSDYWQSGRIEGNGGSIGVAIFDLTTIVPIGSFISRIQLVASTNDHGDGKVFIAQTISALLSVKYESFNVQKISNSAAINFSIAQPAPGSTFTIERSVTGTNFTAIGTIAGTNATSYSYTDMMPVLTAKNYYRIKEVDAQGRVSYSDIRMVKFTRDGKVDIYPIPAATNISITFGDEVINKPIVISLYNNQGQALMQKQVSRANATEVIDIANYANGTYQLRVTSNTEIITNRKVVIMK